jgi:transcription-repair coupling factor (superfamily II helicase)
VADPALALLAEAPGARAARTLVAGAIEGLDARHLAQLADRAGAGQLLHVARDAARATLLAELVRFFAPALEVTILPAWDCLP